MVRERCENEVGEEVLGSRRPCVKCIGPLVAGLEMIETDSTLLRESKISKYGVLRSLFRNMCWGRGLPRGRKLVVEY